MKAAKAVKRFVYPTPKFSHAGCKVSFNYYEKYSDALEAGRVADIEGRHLAAKGYDFGFRVPGAIGYVEDGPYAGTYQVVIP